MTTKTLSRLFLLVCFSALTFLAFVPNQDVTAADLRQFDSPLPTPPANDNFAQATEITSIPFSDWTDATYATVEPGEPFSSCYYDQLSHSIWYKYTPATDEVLFFRTIYVPLFTIYTGTSLQTLHQQNCYWYPGEFGYTLTGGTTYYFQAASPYGDSFALSLLVEQAPPPNASFYYYPYDPAKRVNIDFYSNSSDPAGQYFESFFWDFGDGTTATGQYATHRYNQDGDYLVTHTVTTSDGRTASIEQIVSVKTHDVAIKRFSRPSTARTGQTKQLIVHIANYGYPEDVNVELYKSVPGGFEYIGFLRQFVNVKPNGRTTKFYLSYTFTQQDAEIGKVIFKAIASPYNAQDYFPADNEFITFATLVKPRRAGATAADEVSSAALDDYTGYNTDTISNVDATLNEVGVGTVDGVTADDVEEAVPGVEDGSNESFKTYLPLIQ